MPGPSSNETNQKLVTPTEVKIDSPRLPEVDWAANKAVLGLVIDVEHLGGLKRAALEFFLEGLGLPPYACAASVTAGSSIGHGTPSPPPSPGGDETPAKPSRPPTRKSAGPASKAPVPKKKKAPKKK